MIGRSAAALAVSVALLTAAPVAAEHDVPFRFTVLGYLKDGRGAPLRDVAVEVVRARTGLAYHGRTDAQGLYVIVTRLGDESVGERLDLHASGRTASIVARFDPADRTRERGTRVDFLAGKPVERAAWFGPTLRRLLAE